MAIRYEKIEKTKNSNSFLVMKQEKINKISNPLGYLYFPERRRE